MHFAPADWKGTYNPPLHRIALPHAPISDVMPGPDTCGGTRNYLHRATHVYPKGNAHR